MEEIAPIGRQFQLVVTDAGVDGAEGGKQPAPGILSPLQYFLATAVSCGTQLRSECRDSIEGVIDLTVRLIARQQRALFRRKQKDEAHHHSERRLVELLLGHPVQQRAAAILVDLVERLNQDLDRIAHLFAKLVGDLLLVGRASIK